MEARSQGGFSGSPVFTYLELAHPRMPIVEARNITLLGIVWGHIPHYKRILEGDKKTRIPQDWWVPDNSNMACVIPAWRIVELLNIQELRDMRSEQAKMLLGAPHAILDLADD